MQNSMWCKIAWLGRHSIVGPPWNRGRDALSIGATAALWCQAGKCTRIPHSVADVGWALLLLLMLSAAVA